MPLTPCSKMNLSLEPFSHQIRMSSATFAASNIPGAAADPCINSGSPFFLFLTRPWPSLASSSLTCLVRFESQMAINW